METLVDFLITYGYWGIFGAGFLAGSFFPFSSETVMLALFATGLDPLRLVIYGSIGNILGGMFNYFIGRQGKIEWIERWLKVDNKKLQRAKHFTERYGAWIGFFSFLPILGSAISIALGLMRSNVIVTLLSIAFGKILRYALLIYTIGLFV